MIHEKPECPKLSFILAVETSCIKTRKCEFLIIINTKNLVSGEQLMSASHQLHIDLFRRRSIVLFICAQGSSQVHSRPPVTSAASQYSTKYNYATAIYCHPE